MKLHMKSYKFYVSALAVLALFSCKNSEKEEFHGKEIGKLYISNEKPIPGDSLQLKYKDANDETTGIYYYSAGTLFYPVDLDLKKENGVATSTIVIPDSATTLAFVYKNGEDYDNNNKAGYILPLYDDAGNQLTGSYAAIANYYSRYGQQQGLDIGNDSIMGLFKHEFDKTPSELDKYDIAYLQLASKIDKPNGKKLIEERLQYYNSKNSLTDDDYGKMAMLYQMVGKDSLANSMREEAITKYPSGKLAFQDFYRKLYTEQDIKKKEEMFEANRNKFLDNNSKTTLISALASSYYKNGEFEKFEKITSEIPDTEIQKASLYNSIAWPLAEKGENLEFAAKISKKSLEITEAAKNNLENTPYYLTNSQFANSMDQQYAMFADTYALILFKQDKFKEAVEYQEKAIGEGFSADMNERYIQFLLTDKQFEKAEEKSKEFIANNNSTAKIKEYYKQAYTENNGSETGYNEALSSLEGQAKQKALDKLRKELIDEEAPKFTLKNLDGQDVSLNDYAGKILIVDFWATWCGPCKASFPGMQMAVNKYKDDPNVGFVFIDTWESFSGEKRMKEVSDFITTNKYTFNVLMDTPVEEGSREYNVIGDYKVNGIPTKFIIGPDGKIKFKAVGFAGSDEGVVSELELMIDMIKQDAS